MTRITNLFKNNICIHSRPRHTAATTSNIQHTILIFLSLSSAASNLFFLYTLYYIPFSVCIFHTIDHDTLTLLFIVFW